MKICICGGGSLGHVCAGVMASQQGVELNILSGHPHHWHSTVTVTDLDHRQFTAHIHKVSANPAEVVASQDIILLCLPGYLIEQTLRNIKPYIGHAAVGTVVSSTGFFFFAHDILERVPFISRVVEYGSTASLLGYKSSLAAVLENIEQPDTFRAALEQLFITPVTLLRSFYEVALSNSNPILHTGRLYTLFHGREHDVFDHNILFYKEWTDQASQLLIDMDAEFFLLLDKLGVHTLPTLLDYYESTDAASLTRKIRSIPAFQTITSPMKPVQGGWVADYTSRYFTEDFPYGLRFIVDLLKRFRIDAPKTFKVYRWGLKHHRAVRTKWQPLPINP